MEPEFNKRAASSVMDAISDYAKVHPNIVAGMLGAGGLGALGGAFLPGDVEEDETAGQRILRRVRNALIGGALGAGSAAAMGHGFNLLTGDQDLPSVKPTAKPAAPAEKPAAPEVKPANEPKGEPDKSTTPEPVNTPAPAPEASEVDDTVRGSALRSEDTPKENQPIVDWHTPVGALTAASVPVSGGIIGGRIGGKFDARDAAADTKWLKNELLPKANPKLSVDEVKQVNAILDNLKSGKGITDPQYDQLARAMGERAGKTSPTIRDAITIADYAGRGNAAFWRSHRNDIPFWTPPNPGLIPTPTPNVTAPNQAAFDTTMRNIDTSLDRTGVKPVADFVRARNARIDSAGNVTPAKWGKNRLRGGAIGAAAGAGLDLYFKNRSLWEDLKSLADWATVPQWFKRDSSK